MCLCVCVLCVCVCGVCCLRQIARHLNHDSLVLTMTPLHCDNCPALPPPPPPPPIFIVTGTHAAFTATSAPLPLAPFPPSLPPCLPPLPNGGTLPVTGVSTVLPLWHPRSHSGRHIAFCLFAQHFLSESHLDNGHGICRDRG